MDALRVVLSTIIFLSVIGSILQEILKEGNAGKLIKFLCGIFLIITIVQYVSHLNLNIPNISEEYAEEAYLPVSMGKDMSENAVKDIITEQLQTYIMDKANSLGAAVKASVTVSDNAFPVPESVLISGSVAADIKIQLAEFLSDEIGIAKEDQYWRD